ncbi:hypothetical protein DSO57_1032148 [Entomophthora muscae]|uniref:Uncharacterized protein n=1 Tax=Entomophthora muscae TaxID=34485 RepID=A0ACC2T0G8_9FUNG|nr:hypothetical protein DSO57_1032148 [Entomophthora muscae]
MLPHSILQEIFSQLDHDQVNYLRLLCRGFYQATFLLLVQVHSLKDAKSIDYQYFLKKHGKHVRGLIIKTNKSYEALLGSGLSLATAFPELRSISYRLAGERATCKILVEDLLAHDNLKHLSLPMLRPEVLPLFFPIIGKLDSLYGYFYPKHIREICQSCKGLKKLLTKALDSNGGLNALIKEASNFPFEVVFLSPDGSDVPLNKKTGSLDWAYFSEPEFPFNKFILKLNPEYPKDMKRSGLNNPQPFNLKLVESKADWEKIINTPNLVKHLIFCNSFIHGIPRSIKYCITTVPSIYFAGRFTVSVPWVFQASKVAFGNHNFDAKALHLLAAERFPNLRNLYITSSFAPLENPHLSPNSLPQLIHFFSNARHEDCILAKVVGVGTEIAAHPHNLHATKCACD